MLPTPASSRSNNFWVGVGFIILAMLLASSSCYAEDCPTPSPCNEPGCNTSQTQSSRNSVVGGSPSASISFGSGGGNLGDWAPIPGQLAWPSYAFNGSIPIKDGMYIPPDVILRYKDTFDLEDAQRMKRGICVKD